MEIGPGPGRLLIPAAHRVLPDGKVVGMDIQHGMIKRLKARAARTGVSNLVAIVGDAAEVDFAQAYFDVVYLCTTLGEIPDRAAVLAQCHTALKADGVLS
ncbi:MAG: class I SAM-dependent methyltransferase, partial [Planctomycetales bacterium]|nr:class I SAM-dependent methyltransferase [Planctomycetales bacterium]